MKITVDKEVLEHALEALEFYYDQHGEESDAKVITAIREVLEQPEQKPVAWKLVFDDGQTRIIKKPIARWKRKMWESAGKRWDTVPLYTTPAVPDRKPLTDKEIAHATAPVFIGGKPSLTGIVRAIEQTHGITGDKNE